MNGSSGVFLVDKPVGPTSRAALNRVQQRLGFEALGHTGTLDPLASGLLVVLAGKARRLQNFLTASVKVYDATIRFGEVSVTLDGEGPVTPTGGVPPSPQDAPALLRRFVGVVSQRPPATSAVRVQGRRAYDLTRRGHVLEMTPRSVRVDAIDLVRAGERDWDVRVTCGPGTYIRSLARDIGEAAGSGAWLAALRRVTSGSFHVGDAMTPDTITADRVIPFAVVVGTATRVDVTAAEARLLRNGLDIPRAAPPGAAPWFAWLDGAPWCAVHAPATGHLRIEFLLEELAAATLPAAPPSPPPPLSSAE